MVYAVVRTGTGSVAGETVEITSAAVTPTAALKCRSYFLEEISGPDAGGSVALTVRDILSRADGKKAKIPRATDGVLQAGINSTVDELIVDLPALAGGADFDSYQQRAASFGSKACQ